MNILKGIVCYPGGYDLDVKGSLAIIYTNE